MPGAIILQSNRFTHWSNFIVSTRCWCLEVSSVARKEVKVFYIDYGNCEWISWDQFTDIHKRFWDLAPQAIPFKLAGQLNFWWFLNPNVLLLFAFILLLKGGVAISPCSFGGFTAETSTPQCKKNSLLMSLNPSTVWSGALIGWHSSHIVFTVVYEWQNKDKTLIVRWMNLPWIYYK